MKTLGKNERVLGRDFTHPAYISIEHRLLRYMLLRLHGVLETCFWRSNPNVQQAAFNTPVVHGLVEADGRHHRIIVIRAEPLKALTNLSIVGFFGQRRLDSESGAAASRDELLFEEMGQQDGLLSYSSLELTNGDYGNCVVFRDEEAKQQWGHSIVHREAVELLSPSFYHSIRLYNGCLPSTLMAEHLLQLTTVRYLDYSNASKWSAVRHLI